jgi:hypothetical protein
MPKPSEESAVASARLKALEAKLAASRTMGSGYKERIEAIEAEIRKLRR